MMTIPYTQAVRDAERCMVVEPFHARHAYVTSTGHRLAGWWRNPKTGEWGIMHTPGTYVEVHCAYTPGESRHYTYVADRYARRVEKVEISHRGRRYFGGGKTWHPVLT